MNIKDIKDPSFLKDLNTEQLKELANDIRRFLLETVSKTGGHLSSNLGVVELTIALHYVFDAPKDRILFDVGHQSYVHKILTGRADQMDTLRQFEGLSGFQKRRESIYDCFEAGHSSTALSTALGMAVARDLNHEDYQVIPVVGDASMMSGLSLEALNQIGFRKNKVIIVFNDNNMSIDKNVGSLTKAFAKLRTSKTYNELKLSIKDILRKQNFGQALIQSIHDVKNKIQNGIVDSGIFNEFDIYYLGPIDGNDIEKLIEAFRIAKEKEYSCVIHCVTKKGKGYPYTENDQDGVWHGVGSFDIATGQFLKQNKEGTKSCSGIIADALSDLMKENEDIVAITPAMKVGSGMKELFKEYPQRTFDCGIAEDHAVCFASGLSLNGKRPFLSIYSSFSQRAYDQFNQELSRMDLPVVVGLDRSGLVGEDGETHHGIYDISFLRPLPNAVIAQGKDAEEMRDLLYSAFLQKHPFFLRYGRGSLPCETDHSFKEIPIGTWEWEIRTEDADAVILSYGPDVMRLKEEILKEGLSCDLVNARFLKPIDSSLMDEILECGLPVYVYTADILKGGLGDEILEYANRKEKKPEIFLTGIDDHEVYQGDTELLKKKEGIDIPSFLKQFKK